MSLAPPTRIFGLKAEPIEGAQPQREEAFELPFASGQTVRITPLRWNLTDLRVEGLESERGWVRSFIAETPEQTEHLVQLAGQFYHDAKQPVPTECGRVPKPFHLKAPSWKSQSQRAWPALNEQPLVFLGQRNTFGAEVYVFRNQVGAVYLFSEVLGEQDPEDHYKDEERHGHRAV